VSKPRTLPCPYCGALHTVAASDADAGSSSIADAHAEGRERDAARSAERTPHLASARRCDACGTPFDDETRRETLARMGPWYIRSEAHPYMPGCSWEQLARFVANGVVTRATIVRGPTTRQLWMKARRVPGVAHLLGTCHACRAKVDPKSAACPACRASFGAPLDRDSLGLTDGTEAIRAHPETADAAPLSAFATNDELREGLHDEVRKRRSFGGTARAAGGGHGAAHAPDAGRSDDSDDDDESPRRNPAWLLVGVPAGFVTVAVVVVGAALAGLIPGLGGKTAEPGARPAHTAVDGADSGAGSARTDGRDALAVGSGDTSGDGASPAPISAAGKPTSSVAASRGTPDTAKVPVPAVTAPGTPASVTPDAAPDAPATPAAAPDSFETVDELISRARDSKVSRGERRRAVSEATARLDELTSASDLPPDVTPAAVEARRSRIDEARRRIDAEIFLRGEGEST